MAGALAQTYTFDSFGKQTASSGSLTSPFQYTGREFDPETGLYYYRARYYDPCLKENAPKVPLRSSGGQRSSRSRIPFPVSANAVEPPELPLNPD